MLQPTIGEPQVRLAIVRGALLVVLAATGVLRACIDSRFSACMGGEVAFLSFFSGSSVARALDRSMAMMILIMMMIKCVFRMRV